MQYSINATNENNIICPIQTKEKTQIEPEIVYPFYIHDSLFMKKKKLIDISKNLTKLEYIEIFNIIQKDEYHYTENKNGIFINLSNIQETTLNKIFTFLNYIKHKKQDLLHQDEYINNVKKNITEINKEIDNSHIVYIEKSIIKENEEDPYFIFSSDEEEDLENKISLKKKKKKYNAKKVKMIKSIKDTNEHFNNKIKFEKKTI